MLALAPAELAGWQQHFARHPWGDYRTQHILACIWSAVASYLGQRQVHPDAVAPWLYPDAEAKRQARAEAAQRAMVLREIQALMDSNDAA